MPGPGHIDDGTITGLLLPSCDHVPGALEYMAAPMDP